MTRKTVLRLRWLRRLSQAFSLCLFLWFLLGTTYSSRLIDLALPELVTTTPLNNFFTFDPLVTLGHAVSTHTLYHGFALSLITLAATAVVGRFFCGWICPFGTLHHMVSRRKAPCGRHPQSLKYFILVFLLVVSGLAFLQVGILDPLCLLARSFTLAVFPTMNALAERGIATVERSAPSALGIVAGRLYRFLESREFIGPAPFFDWSLLTAGILAALLVADLSSARFWCRFLCPLGALLGLASRFSITRLYLAAERCTRCGRCAAVCRAGSLSVSPPPRPPGAAVRWKAAECHLCLNCQAECPEDALGFTMLGVRDAAEYSPDLSRRGLIASIGAGLLAVPLLRAGAALSRRSRPLRPPGALAEKEFLAACLRCGSCSRICPTSALHPSILEAGIEGIWTPRLVPRIGYCVFSCTLCGQVCPSQAIRRLSAAEKMGSSESPPFKIGTAAVDRARCLPWAKMVRCAACEEVCPVSPKAIDLVAVSSRGRGRMRGAPRGPLVNALRCVGCGHCENVCPVEGAAAIRVFPVGESRAGGGGDRSSSQRRPVTNPPISPPNS